MPKLTVNSKEVTVEQGATVLQACEAAGAEIPRFCYHERLKIAGNCRMCLVQIEGGPPKPAASCAMPAADNMVVHTDTEMVKKAREGVMEFLLMNHPLDCPICDQGGECDLQDQAMAYGRGTSRYREQKRAVNEKYMGPLIKTHMTRCIHCTRCVRFLDDVSGIQELGAVGRGEHMEITTYVGKSLSSELSANIIDLCPVGALTSKPYAFKARPWELIKTESVNALDATGAAIRVDSKHGKVLRIMPRLHEAINEEWLDDKSRFSCDGLGLQRLDKPYIKKNNSLKPASWQEALELVTTRIKEQDGHQIAALTGNLSDAESMFMLKRLWNALGSPHIDCRTDYSNFVPQQRSHYLTNATIERLEEADALLLIGTNPRKEAPLVNARLRKAYLNHQSKAAYIGPEIESTFPAEHLGESAKLLTELASGKHPFAKTLQKAKKPVILLGAAMLTRDDAEAIISAALKLSATLNHKDWSPFNVLHHTPSRVAGLDLGILPESKGKTTRQIIEAAESGEIRLLYLLNVDEINFTPHKDCLVVYQGHHGDLGAHLADVILPGAAYTEKQASFINTEGRAQQTRQAVSPPGEAKEDWHIINTLSQQITGAQPLDTESLYKAMREQAPALEALGEVRAAPFDAKHSYKGSIKAASITYPIDDYYRTDPISRASRVMAECVKSHQQTSKEAA